MDRSSSGNNTRFHDSNQFHKSIVFRFGVPHSIITDNGTDFTSKEFKNYYEGMGIKLNFATITHPQTKGQVKKANGLICNGIKKRLLAPLEKAKHVWVDELPSVLWSLRTTPNAATQEMPFFLVHGAGVVLPVEITHEAPRILTYDKTISMEHSKMTSTHWMKQEMLCWLDPRNINKIYGIIIALKLTLIFHGW
jgi:hypothetical protein